jgi:hypothetical protein
MTTPSISTVVQKILGEHRLLTLLNGDVYRWERQWRPVVPMLLELWALEADDPEATTIARRQEIVAYLKLKTIDIDPNIQHGDLDDLQEQRPVHDDG